MPLTNIIQPVILKRFLTLRVDLLSSYTSAITVRKTFKKEEIATKIETLTITLNGNPASRIKQPKTIKIIAMTSISPGLRLNKNHANKTENTISILESKFACVEDT